MTRPVTFSPPDARGKLHVGFAERDYYGDYEVFFAPCGLWGEYWHWVEVEHPTDREPCKRCHKAAA